MYRERLLDLADLMRRLPDAVPHVQFDCWMDWLRFCPEATYGDALTMCCFWPRFQRDGWRLEFQAHQDYCGDAVPCWTNWESPHYAAGEILYGFEAASVYFGVPLMIDIWDLLAGPAYGGNVVPEDVAERAVMLADKLHGTQLAA